MSQQLRWKSLQDYIKEDPSLSCKITADDFYKGASAPRNSDITIMDAFKAYKEFMNHEGQKS